MGISGHQSLLGQHQISQTKQCPQLGGVLGHAAIAGLAVLEQVLHHMKSILVKKHISTIEQGWSKELQQLAR